MNVRLIFYLVYVFLSSLVILSCKKDNISDSERADRATAFLINEKIPDFSFAGYKNSNEPLPKVPTVITLSPLPGDNYDQIQNAIHKLIEYPLTNGFRGAILLKAGDYGISKEIKIQSSGIVLRGEGQGNNGTKITIQSKFTTKNISTLQSTAAVSIVGSGLGFKDKQKANSKITKDLHMGTKILTVENSSGFSIGDTIAVTKTPNEEWIDALGMRPYNWTTEYYNIAHQKVITAINNNELTLNIPMVDDVTLSHGGGWVSVIEYDGMIENSAVENIRFISTFLDEEDESHTWNAVVLKRVKNCWVRNITAENFAYSAVQILRSDNNTVQDCAILNFKSKNIGDRRYSFYISIESTGNLFQRCYSSGGRHDFVTSAKVTGPNVFLDCVAINTSADTGPHHRWASGTLFDNIYAGLIYAINGKDNGTGHGWTGVYQMFWNNHATQGFMIQDPPIGRNWIMGATGLIYSKNTASSLSQGVNVLPRSLFIHQLTQRLGVSKVKSIVSEKQLHNSTIWQQLLDWAGNENPLVQL